MENQHDELADARLEREIRLAKDEFDAAIGNPEALRLAWLKLSGLVMQRSEAQVEKMEIEKGLQ